MPELEPPGVKLGEARGSRPGIGVPGSKGNKFLLFCVVKPRLGVPMDSKPKFIGIEDEPADEG